MLKTNILFKQSKKTDLIRSSFLVSVFLFQSFNILADEEIDSPTTDIPTTNIPARLEPEVIRFSDDFSSIEEHRVRAIESEIRVVPRSGNGYFLVSPSNSGSEIAGGSTQSAHHSHDELLIPSWQLFTW